MSGEDVKRELAELILDTIETRSIMDETIQDTIAEAILRRFCVREHEWCHYKSTYDDCKCEICGQRKQEVSE